MVQAYSAWYSALPRGSPPTEIRRRHVLRFPRPQDEYFFFRMQRDASLNPCNGLFHRGHTCTRVWQYEGRTSIENHNVTFVNHRDTASKGLRTLSPWNVARLEMSLPPCRSVRTVAVNSADCLSFHLQGPRIVVFSPSPWTVSDQHLANRLGFTTDSRAPESTVISRY